MRRSAETGDVAYSPYGIGYAGASLGGAGGSWPGAFAGLWQDAPGNLDNSPLRLLAPMMEVPQEIPLARPRWPSPDTGAPGAQLRALVWEPAGLAAVNPADPQTSTPRRSAAPWGAPVRNAYAYVANQPLSFTDPLGPLGTNGPNCGNPCNVIASPWNRLSPSYWRFAFGVEGAAELEQTVGAGAAKAAAAVAGAVKSIVGGPNVRAVNQCAAKTPGDWSIAGLIDMQNNPVVGGVAGNSVGTVSQLIWGPAQGTAAEQGAVGLTAGKAWEQLGSRVAVTTTQTTSAVTEGGAVTVWTAVTSSLGQNALFQTIGNALAFLGSATKWGIDGAIYSGAALGCEYVDAIQGTQGLP
ncbi:MAG: hypothetical protein ACRD2E_02040 [Terriglobales bacterium]